MDLRQLTVCEQFGWINMRAVTFSFVDQSSSRGLKKFCENIPTSPISPEVIDVHTLNFNPNFKFSRLIFFFWGGGTPSQLGCALGRLGQSLAHVKISGRSPPKGENTVSRKILTSITFSIVDQISKTFLSPTWEGSQLINCFFDFRLVDPLRRCSRSNRKLSEIAENFGRLFCPPKF